MRLLLAHSISTTKNGEAFVYIITSLILCSIVVHKEIENSEYIVHLFTNGNGVHVIETSKPQTSKENVIDIY